MLFSPVAGRSGHNSHGPYAASKAAISQVVRVAADECTSHGVTVNAVAAGYMDIALTEAYLVANPETRARGSSSSSRRDGSGNWTRWSVPCCSCPLSRELINGQILYVDGGRTVV